MRTPPATVLVIEGHPMMRAALCSAIADEPDLTIAGVTSDAMKVLNIAETLHPDLILFSVGNPGWQELFALTLLHDAHPTIPILALTTNEVQDQEQIALNYGAQVVLTKSASRAELLHSLCMMKASMQQNKKEDSYLQKSEQGTKEEPLP